MKRLSIFYIIFSVFFMSCDKYELIGDKKRFNKRSGNTELLQESGEWLTVKQIEDNKKEEERQKENELKEKLLKVPLSEYEKIKPHVTTTEDLINGEEINYLSVGLRNNSEWKIQEIEFTISVYDSDGSHLIDRKVRMKSYSDFDGVPHSVTFYKGRIVNTLHSQKYKYYISDILGYKY